MIRKIMQLLITYFAILGFDRLRGDLMDFHIKSPEVYMDAAFATVVVYFLVYRKKWKELKMEH
jgi:hypothetical protein